MNEVISRTQATTDAALLQESDDNIEWKALLASAQKAMAAGREERISPKLIRRMEGQPRTYFNTDSIARLAVSMSTIGQIVPGIVRPISDDGDTKYELLDGERRWRAALSAGLTYRAIVVSISDTAVPFIIAAVANFNREGHTPTEMSDTVHQMQQLNIPLPEIAKVLGVSEFWALQMAGLQNLHENVREMLDPNRPKRERLPVTAAIQISKMVQHLQTEVAERVLSSKLSLKRLRSEVVRVSRSAGVPIRERKRASRKTYESLMNNLGAIERTANDIRAIMEDPDFKYILTNRPSYTKDTIVNGLEEAKEHIHECEMLMKRTFP